MVPAQKRTFEFLPLSIGIETQGGIYTPLVLRGTPLPAKRWETFSTAADNQVSVEVALFLGESLLSENNIPLGKFHLKGIPPAARGKPQVKIEFSVDTSCAVTARATLEGSEWRAEQAFYPPEELSDPFIAKTLANAESSRKEDEATLKVVESKRRARELIYKAEQQLGEKANAKLSSVVAALGLALSADDSEAIRVKSDELASLVEIPQFDFSNFFGPQSTFPDIFGQPKPPTRRATSRFRESSNRCRREINSSNTATNFG